MIYKTIVCFLLAFSCSQLTSAEDLLTTRVMSFNIRYGTASDGENSWNDRKAFLVETIKAFEPDLLGTQETLGFQRDYLAEQLPNYDHVGVGRTNGKQEGEMAAVFFRKDRYQKNDEGHFWFSESPEKPGSISWDSSLPRMVTWVRLKDLKDPKRTLLFLNTHFDHIGVTARNESSQLLRSKIESLREDASVIVTGDFNAGEESDPYRILFGEDKGIASPIVDCYRVANTQRTKSEGTFSGFLATNLAGARIDWIGATRDFQVLSSEIDRTAKNGRTPSDHFPVTAILGQPLLTH